MSAKSNTKCNCGTLERMSKEADGPFVYDPSQNLYTLQISDGERFAMKYCTFCGGDFQKFRVEYPAACHCETVSKWTRNPLSLIKQDADSGQVFYVRNSGSPDRVGEHRTPLHWCPACGGHLVGTDELSKSEIAEFRRRLKGVKTLTAVIKELGKPDGVFVQESENSHVWKEPSEIKNVESQEVSGLTYTHLSETVHVWITKSTSEPGTLRVNAWQAKQRPTNPTMSTKHNELLRVWAMRAIADDYEDLTMIKQDVTSWALEIGHSITADEITEALLKLIDSGIAAAYILSTQQPFTKKIPGRPRPNEVAKCHFMLTEEGRTELAKDK